LAQLFLADLSEKTWRGQLGRALQGKQPGGKAFGYDIVEPDRDHKASTASAGSMRPRRRSSAGVFRAFADGHSPRAIAKQLNDEGIPGPPAGRGGHDLARASRSRTPPAQQYALYRRMEWNRCSYVEEPADRQKGRPRQPAGGA